MATIQAQMEKISPNIIKIWKGIQINEIKISKMKILYLT
jgi:hypothetical protein